MKLKNIRAFINAASQNDIKYVAKRAGIGYEYFTYHIGTGRKEPTEDTARKLELASISLTKRKPDIPVLRCTDFIDTYKTCPHGIELGETK